MSQALEVAATGAAADAVTRWGVTMTSLPIAPLMHGASQWATMGAAFVGNLVNKYQLERVRVFFDEDERVANASTVVEPVGVVEHRAADVVAHVFEFGGLVIVQHGAVRRSRKGA